MYLCCIYNLYIAELSTFCPCLLQLIPPVFKDFTTTFAKETHQDFQLPGCLLIKNILLMETWWLTGEDVVAHSGDVVAS